MNNERKITYDIAYMEMAKAVSTLSYAERSKVGCIIVTPQGQVIAQGYNGTPTGMDNCCETIEKILNEEDSNLYGHDIYENKLITKREVLHAESNAITKCAKNGCGSTEGSTIYITLSPCFECSKLIIQAGIKRIVYKEQYRLTDGLDLLNEVGIICEQLDIEKKKLIRYEPNK